MKKFKKFMVLLLVLCIMTSISTTAFAIAPSTDVHVAYIPNVGSNSKNLKTSMFDNAKFNTTVEAFSFAQDENGNLTLGGIINQLPFNVVATPYASPANENVQVFDANDTLGNYNVIYSAVERNIHDSALYFDNLELNTYTNVIKLYLRPDNSGDFIVLEIFTVNDFASEYLLNPISQDANAPGKVNQLWYAKVFTPEIKALPIQDEVQPYYIDHHSSTTEYSYEFSHLGYTWKQRLALKTYVSYPTSFSNSEDFATRFEVMDERTQCYEAPNESSDESHIEVQDLRMDIAIDAGNACGGYEITGYTEADASASVQFEFNTSLDLWGFASITLNYEEAKRHQLNDSYTTFATDEGTPRQLGAALGSNEALTQDGDYFQVNWDIENHGGTQNSQAFKVRFTYTMVNYLNSPQWSHQEQTENVTVYYDTTA